MKNNIKEESNLDKKGIKQIIILIIAIIVIICLGINFIFNYNKKYIRTQEKFDTKQESEKLHNIDITTKNWNQYFEIADVEEWRYNSFDEIVGITLNKVIRLKPRYQGRLASDSKIAFELSGVINEKLINLDYTNKKYSIKNSTINESLENGINHKITTSLELYTGSSDRANTIIYGSNDSHYISAGKEVSTISVFEKIKVIRTKGTLHIYE